MKRISLCIIVRDEEFSLARCLTSAQSVVDEICVLDTGSSDQSIEVARQFGARVAERAWDDDFSAARNAVLELATGDFVLVLDADEELLDGPGAREVLESFMERSPSAAGRVRIENRDEAGECSSVSISRFFPRAGFSFRGCIHEQLVFEGGESFQREDTGLRVEHHGYALEGAQRIAKLERNTRLLMDSLEKDPEDAYLWYQLGRTLYIAEDHQAAVEALEQALMRCPDDAPWAAGLFEIGAYSLRALGLSGQALTLLSEVEGDFASRADTCFLIGLLSMDCGDLERAEQSFRRCLDLDSESGGDSESSYAASTYAPAFNLGVMNEVLGDHEQAEVWFRRALEFRSDHAPSLEALERVKVS